MEVLAQNRLKLLRQTGGPQHRQVGLRRGAQILQACAGNGRTVLVTMMPAVDAHAADGFRHPRAGRRRTGRCIPGVRANLTSRSFMMKWSTNSWICSLGVNARRQGRAGRRCPGTWRCGPGSWPRRSAPLPPPDTRSTATGSLPWYPSPAGRYRSRRSPRAFSSRPTRGSVRCSSSRSRMTSEYMMTRVESF